MARIIAGQARGRKLRIPEEGTRPTSDRAKEGLFSSLDVRFGFHNRRVLDLFAGSGALGLEAISRGADMAVLVESNPKAAAICRENAKAVGLGGVFVEETKASTYVASAPRDHFDMVLADPPYDVDDETINEIIDALRPLLRDGAVVVFERSTSSSEPQWPEDFHPTTQKLKKRTYGTTRFDMAVFEKAEG
ncbi:RsmD family RNA methyltransferase [Corynebacterium pyruviciproducens ATCC BAA-1742]|uniref:RsmD family RNA methyltransferase n=1 Tax=Corynebacterium pyruviciproducens ATCC BAA-1742 TaxID=1125779 RepID=S3A2N0_9CORY|nr:16S rRNA (guanine(966)-N(2))-methyltransferase RsmD [Corynebacterium pyruviciproducens]EPD70514.1 RsmD family RNA methyltransferase [Corynebacterium pyruviciproducens ATCC BAA-1742]